MLLFQLGASEPFVELIWLPIKIHDDTVLFSYWRPLTEEFSRAPLKSDMEMGLQPPADSS